jgi:hypothetical protein
LKNRFGKSKPLCNGKVSGERVKKIEMNIFTGHVENFLIFVSEKKRADNDPEN